ncbi:MAG: CotH kinase family protein [Oscillospiraceae bacterium]|nr:CotH kinase family protein [Oscillospiraceae bacterium]
MRLKPKFISAFLAVILTAASVPYSNQPHSVKAADFTVYINEICTQNKSCLTDGYGEYSDWIEFYNPGNTDADLSGYAVSDNTDEPMKWIFPSGTIIAAGEHKIIFASKQSSTASELHTGFALSKNGETLVLSSPQGQIIQQITVPALVEDSTYGRTPDGSETFEIMSATPGYPNNTVTSQPRFSADSGFYGADFSLTLSAASGDTIYYTTDGSDPTGSSTAQIYTQAITVSDRTNQPNVYSKYAENMNSAQSVCLGIGYKQPPYNVDKAFVVRAAAKNSNGTFSAVSDATYFVTTQNLSQYKDLTVVSLVTDPDNLFDPAAGIYVTGNQYIDWKNSSSYNPNKSVWDTDNVTNYFSKGRDWEREANITVFKNGELAAGQNMGIRIKGASTRNAAQKSFNLYARSEYGASKLNYPLIDNNYSLDGNLIEKYDTVCLRSVSDEVRLRDGFAQKLLSDREHITTQDMQQCVVFLNGEYWGLYEMTEKLSDYFIESNYGIEKENVAMIKNGELEEGDQSEYDSFYDFVYTYSKKDLSDPVNYKAVCDFIDTDSLIEHFAAGLYLGTFDWPNYNYGVWRNTGDEIQGNPYSDGRWKFISFDYDYTMGATYKDFGGVEGYAYDSFRHMDNANTEAPTNLFVSLLKNENFRNKFANVYCDYANEVLTSEKANAMAQTYNSNYTERLASTVVRWWGYFGGSKESNLSYNRNLYQNTTLNNIRKFFSNRADYTLEDMKNYLGLQGSLQTITLKTSGNGKIQINSACVDTSNGSWSGKYYSDCPVTLTVIPDDGAEFSGWEGDITGSDKTVTMSLSQAMTVQADFVEKTEVACDVNADGVFNVADAVMLQNWLINAGDITDWQAGDLNENGRLDAADFCLLKKELIGNY